MLTAILSGRPRIVAPLAHATGSSPLGPIADVARGLAVPVCEGDISSLLLRAALAHRMALQRECGRLADLRFIRAGLERSCSAGTSLLRDPFPVKWQGRTLVFF